MMKRYASLFLVLAVLAGSAAFTVTQDAATPDPERLARIAECLQRSADDARKVRCVERAMEGYAAPAAPASATPSADASPSEVDAPSEAPSEAAVASPSRSQNAAGKPDVKRRSLDGSGGGKSLRFSIECDPGKIEQIDPLVSPGKVSAHLHNFFGNAGVTAYRDPVGVAQRRGTTCQFSQDTGAYWTPLLFDRYGNALPIQHALVYYRHSRSGGVDPHFPNTGLVTPRYEWICSDEDTFASPPDCRGRSDHPHGAGIRFIFDPQQLPNGQWTPRIAYNIRYGVEDLTGAYFHTRVAPHADFWNTWRQGAYTELVDRCLDPSGVWRTYTTAEWEARCGKVTDADFALGD